MTQRGITTEYFEWLYDMVCESRFGEDTSYRKLFSHLHNIEFRYSIPMDANRAEDGIGLRYRFAVLNGYKDSFREVLGHLDGPCSVFEMMVALAIRCEEDTMDDAEIGDRTSQWFWGMIVNLGLGSMSDSRFDRRFVDYTIDIFLDRDYEPDGRGGLFTVRNSDSDLRDVEIWHQLCWYLDSIT